MGRMYFKEKNKTNSFVDEFSGAYPVHQIGQQCSEYQYINIDSCR